MVYIFTPLSPRWLLIQCERTQARESLAKLRNLEPNSEIVNNEIEEIEDSLQQGIDNRINSISSDGNLTRKSEAVLVAISFTQFLEVPSDIFLNSKRNRRRIPEGNHDNKISANAFSHSYW